jgi:DNA-directed RNA polymerase specialized sigma24 family protein
VYLSKFDEVLSDNADVVDTLRAWARRKTPTLQEADDVVQSALDTAVRVARGGKDYVPGDPALTKKTLASYLTPFLRNALSERMRQAKRKPSEAVGDGADIVDDSPSAEDHASAALAMKRLREGVADQTNADLLLKILDAFREGVEGPTELSTRLKCPIPDIIAAHKRLTRCAQRIAEEDAS